MALFDRLFKNRYKNHTLDDTTFSKIQAESKQSLETFFGTFLKLSKCDCGLNFNNKTNQLVLTLNASQQSHEDLYKFLTSTTNYKGSEKVPNADSIKIFYDIDPRRNIESSQDIIENIIDIKKPSRFKDALNVIRSIPANIKELLKESKAKETSTIASEAISSPMRVERDTKPLLNVFNLSTLSPEEKKVIGEKGANPQFEDVNFAIKLLGASLNTLNRNLGNYLTNIKVGPTIEGVISFELASNVDFRSNGYAFEKFDSLLRAAGYVQVPYQKGSPSISYRLPLPSEAKLHDAQTITTQLKKLVDQENKNYSTTVGQMVSR